MILSLASMACFSAPSMAAESNASSVQASGSAPPVTLPQDSGALQSLTKDDLKVLATNGSKLLDAQIGDLTGQGNVAALVVLEHPAGDPSAGEGPLRTLLLVARDAHGKLRTLAQNDKIVPCARCGGVAGDPYSYSRVAPGRFTVVTEGGSREHWWNEFHFRYAPKVKAWVLHKAVRGVSDTTTGRKKQINLSEKTLGAIKLNDFDPSSLPQVKLN
ncbi:hypothetical protein [Variovorax sp. ZT4R33]|uniref:hypothetical protein n=1 Tax=Variovorax sp. ZT4R33 TaxID=3443743 RepID=UPI003F47FEA4